MLTRLLPILVAAFACWVLGAPVEVLWFMPVAFLLPSCTCCGGGADPCGICQVAGNIAFNLTVTNIASPRFFGCESGGPGPCASFNTSYALSVPPVTGMGTTCFYLVSSAFTNGPCSIRFVVSITSAGVVSVVLQDFNGVTWTNEITGTYTLSGLPLDCTSAGPYTMTVTSPVDGQCYYNGVGMDFSFG